MNTKTAGVNNYVLESE